MRNRCHLTLARWLVDFGKPEDRADPPYLMKDLLKMIAHIGEAIMQPRNVGAYPVDESHESSCA